MNQIKSDLTKLKLSGIVKTVENRNAFALENKISYINFLELLIDDEKASRLSNSYKRRFTRSKLTEQKQIEDYDFSYQPQIDKKQIQDLASCRFINEKKNIIFMGKPGTGKTHLANAIGLEALKQNYKVIFMHLNDLIEKLFSARGDGTYNYNIRNLLNADLLIIDEIGFKKIPQNGLDDFFEIIRKRYERGSIIITTNRNFEDWGKVFGDQVLASAIIDRLVHHAYIIKIKGESYRIKNYKLKNKT